MKRIPLTQGKFAIVDDEDFDWLNQWKWSAFKCPHTFYVERSIYSRDTKKARTVRLHREILGLKKDDGKQADHINGSGLDNRRCNLRVCTRSENNRNMQKQFKICSSKYKGVNWRKNRKKWRAEICKDYKHIHIGYFDSEIEAAEAYDKKAKELFGEFARTNF